MTRLCGSWRATALQGAVLPDPNSVGIHHNNVKDRRSDSASYLEWLNRLSHPPRDDLDAFEQTPFARERQGSMDISLASPPVRDVESPTY